ncbi:MAG: hypothetical protein ACKO85_19840, partial [Isosphaeraceae bacterium]
DLIYGGAGNDYLLGGLPQSANTKHEPRNPLVPNDGNDTISGGDGLDTVDGGNGDNLLDAGDDGIRETILGGTGADWYYTHRHSVKSRGGKWDLGAVDGGKYRVLNSGQLIEPPVTQPTFKADVVYGVPLSSYTGQIFVNGMAKEYPPLSKIPGHAQGWAPPFNTPVVTSASLLKARKAKLQ